MKPRYYKDVINSTLSKQNYLSILTSSKKRMTITKRITNSHELQSETELWCIPQTSWEKGICHLCNSKRVEDEIFFAWIAWILVTLVLIS